MADRYFLPDLTGVGEVFELGGGEWHHLARVMRLKVGDRVVVFDGAGTEADAEITNVSKAQAALRILNRRCDPPASRPPIVLATAIPKSDRFRWLVEKATELGVARLIPLATARSVVDPGAGKLERMRQAVIEACKQSGRNRLMKIEPTMTWDAFVGTVVPTGRALVADPSGSPLRLAAETTLPRAAQTMLPLAAETTLPLAAQTMLPRAAETSSAMGPVILAVGPEGGLTEPELQQARDAGATPVSLGRQILRIETAAIALAAFVALRDYDPP